MPTKPTFTPPERVRYEVIIHDTKASLLRTFQAILECGARLRDQYKLDVWVLLIELEPGREEDFRRRVKPFQMRYYSPTWFDNGTLRPLYASPDAEIAERVRKREEANSAWLGGNT